VQLPLSQDMVPYQGGQGEHGLHGTNRLECMIECKPIHCNPLELLLINYNPNKSTKMHTSLLQAWISCQTFNQRQIFGTVVNSKAEQWQIRHLFCFSNEQTAHGIIIAAGFATETKCKHPM